LFYFILGDGPFPSEQLNVIFKNALKIYEKIISLFNIGNWTTSATTWW
jgi:hypothetical protein